MWSMMRTGSRLCTFRLPATEMRGFSWRMRRGRWRTGVQGDEALRLPADGALRAVKNLLAEHEHGEENQPGQAHGVPEPGGGVDRDLPVLDVLEPAEHERAHQQRQDSQR